MEDRRSDDIKPVWDFLSGPLTIMDNFRFGAFVRHAWRSRTGQNLFALYGVQLANYLLPLITIPYLSRVLRPSGFGLVVFAQAFASVMHIVLDYGFMFSGARDVARNRDSPDKLAIILSDILGAKVVLSLIIICFGGVVVVFVPTFQANPRLLFAALIWALGMGMNAFWFFQGLERMRLRAVLDIGAKALAVVLIFLLIQSPKDAYLVLVITGLCALASAVTSFIAAFREVPFLPLSLRSSLRMLGSSWRLFVFRGAVGLYGAANPFLLGLVANAIAVGYYGAADKVLVFLWASIGPISQVFFPRLSFLAASNVAKAASETTRLMFAMLAYSLLLAVAVTVVAPWFVAVVFGHDYLPVVRTLRLLAWSLPFSAVSGNLGINWLLPTGREKQYLRAVLIGMTVNVALGLLLGSHFGSDGMAVAKVSAEILVAAVVVLTLVLNGGLPWRQGDVRSTTEANEYG